MVTTTGRHDRGIKILMVVSISILMLTVVHTVLIFSSPFDGVNINFGGVRSQWTVDGVLVLPVVAYPEGVQPNDIVTFIDGHSMREIGQNLFGLSQYFQPHLPASLIYYTVQRNGLALEIPVPVDAFPVGLYVAQQWGNWVVILPLLALAIFVLWRARPTAQRDAARVFFCTTLCIIASVIVNSWPLRLSLTTQPNLFWSERLMMTSVAFMLIGIILHFTLIFPQPHSIVKRNWMIIPLVYVVPWLILIPALVFIRYTSAPGLLMMKQWSTVADWTIAGGLCLVAVLQIVNYRFSRYDPVARQRARWVVFGYALTIVVIAGLTTLPRYLFGQPVVSRNYFGLLMLPFLICLAVAILRYQVFDLDLLINRALVHATLTALVATTYVLIVVPIPAMLRVQNDLPFFIAAAVLVTVAFQPARERVQQMVNRLMYGQRDEPYIVLSQLGQRLEATLLPQDVASTIVEVISQTLKLPYAALVIRDNETTDTASVEIASSGCLPNYPLINLPLTYQRMVVGELHLAPRAAGESLEPADQRLLLDLARQAGIAAYAFQQTRRALQLAADLQHSRERLVTAREEERRRLRRDLHDGLGPQLASQTLSLDAVAKLIRSDPDRAESLLRSLREQTQQAVVDIRELVYELRPPTLDDLGLCGAIHQLADRLAQMHPPLTIMLQTRNDLPRLVAAVEVAAYRITQEALTNVVRHAGAKVCHVALRVASETDAPFPALIIEIADDGRGVALNRISGVGLQSMRERAEELGGRFAIEPISTGGTLVRAELPLHREEAYP